MTDAFTAALMAARDQMAAFEALYQFSQSVRPVRLWTVMVTDMEAGVARRAFSNMPDAYPTSGTKPIPDNDWFDIVHTQRRTFVANDIETIAGVFPDHETIAALGCASVVNLPIRIGDAMAGSINLLDGPDAFPPETVAKLETHLRLPALACLAAARALPER